VEGLEGDLKVDQVGAEACVHHQLDCRLNRVLRPVGGTRGMLEIERDGVGIGVEVEVKVGVM
jgi:hypothetical protein